jgi:N-methylhydantoinase A
VPVHRPPAHTLPRHAARCSPNGQRSVYFYRVGFLDTAIYRSALLSPGDEIVGPAIVERPDTTIVIGPRQRMHVEPYGNFIIDL